MRRHAIEHGIPTITSLDTLFAVTECLASDMTPDRMEVREIGEFGRLVADTRHRTLPENETPSQNVMVKK